MISCAVMKRIHCRQRFLATVLFLLCGAFEAFGGEALAGAELHHDASLPGAWTKLSGLPDREGFAGAFAGVSGAGMLVAGGANFPAAKPWEGGAKIWHDDVFLLERTDATKWNIVGKLPRPLGYGVSITTPAGVICIGGSDAKGHHREVFALSWKDGALHFKSLPDLPTACANCAGARLGDTIYVAGGIERPDSTTAMKTFWSFDLRDEKSGWKQQPTWSGPGRMLAVAAADHESFHLFSGAALKAGADGKPVRDYLQDAYRYTPATGWKRLADMPRPAVAAPSPALAMDGKILISGGDDGAQVATPPAVHKGFPRDALMYDSRLDRWSRAGDLPFSFATTPTVVWNELFIVPGGETRPGIRSTGVWAVRKN